MNKEFNKIINEVVQKVFDETKREDFELILNQEFSLKEFVERNKEYMNIIDQDNFYRNKVFEPIMNVSLGNCWATLSKITRGFVLNKMTMVKKLVATEYADMFEGIETRTEDEKKNDKKSNDRNALKNKLKQKIDGKSHSGKFKKVQGKMDLDTIKNAFNGMAGEGVVKELIDSLAGGIKNMDKIEVNDKKEKTDIDRQLDEITSKLPQGMDFDPKLKALASSATESFAPKLDESGADGEELLKKANSILKKLKKMNKGKK